MTIKEVENALGITRANVRFYEKEGLIFPKRNPINDYRDYSEQDVETLRRILFLRSLDIPIETIRRLEQGKENMQEVLKEQLEEYEHQQRKIGEAKANCQKLMAEEKLEFFAFEIPESVAIPQNKTLKDALTELWMFWDKLVIWGFLALQVIYTLIVFPMLPEQIPTSWQGMTVTDYMGKCFFFFYLVISIIYMYCVRMILYMWAVGVARFYLDELNAIGTVGAIGIGFSMQVYTVLYLQGVRIEMDAFLLGCAAAYIAVVFLIVFIYRKYNRRV